MTVPAGCITVAAGYWLRADAGAAYLAMLAAGCPAGITSATRTRSLQWDYWTHQGEPGWPATADHPDHSKHVWRPDDAADTGARALDLPEPARTWVRAHGAAYGWIAGKVKGEPWHFEYNPALDTHRTAGEDWFDMATKADLQAAVAAARPPVWGFFVSAGVHYEAQLLEGWYRALPDAATWAGRQDVLGSLGVPVRQWPKPVTAPTKFGQLR